MIFSFIISLLGLLLLLTNSILFFSFRKGKDTIYKFLMFYLIIQFVVELFCHIIGFLNPNQNFFLSHYYFVIQFVILSVFFYKVIKKVIFKKAILISLGVVLSLLSFQYYNEPQLYWEFNLFEIGITSFLLISYAIFYFYENLIGTYVYHYFCLGLTFYLTSSCLIFLTGNTQLVFITTPFLVDIWIFNSLFFILYQILIFKEWYLLKTSVEQTNEKIQIQN